MRLIYQLGCSTKFLFTPQPDLAYHSSAIMASALDTATLVFRAQQSPCSLPALCDTLTAAGRKVSMVLMLM